MKEKININFYIEGGRSRTGKFLQPKAGMLGFLLDIYFDGAVDDLTFIPTYVGYDQVPEEKSYLQELRGKEKQKESFFSFLESRKILQTKYGAAYIRFHGPVSIREFVERSGKTSNVGELTSAEKREIAESFAFYLMSGISEASVITFTELAAAALVCHGSSQVERSVFLDAINSLAICLRDHGIEVSGGTQELEKGCDHAVERFKSRKFVELEGAAETEHPIYVLNESRRVNLEFYKNSLLNCLWRQAIMATAILEANRSLSVSREMVERKFNNLEELLKKEFIFDPLVQDHDLLNRSAEFFEKQGWITRDAATENFEVSNANELGVFAGLLSDILRVYKSCLAALNSMGDETVSERDFIKLATKTAGDMGLFPSPENITMSNVTVRNALTELTKLRVAEYNQTRKKVKRGKADPKEIPVLDI